MNVKLQGFKTQPMEKTEMHVTIETITAEKATEYLKVSRGNRSIKEAKVTSYARDMAAGKWALNGEAIIFDFNGCLVNGHHRLLARKRISVDFQSVVVRGVAPDAVHTMDTGASRSLADVLAFGGESNVTALSGGIHAAVAMGIGYPRSTRITSSELRDFVQEYPASRLYATNSISKAIPRAGSALVGLGIAAHYTGKAEIYDRFMHVIKTGVPSRRGCPAHALRERVLKDAGSRNKMSVRDVHFLCVTAWKKFVDGEAVTRLVVGNDFTIPGWKPAISYRLKPGRVKSEAAK